MSHETEDASTGGDEAPPNAGDVAVPGGTDAEGLSVSDPADSSDQATAGAAALVTDAPTEPSEPPTPTLDPASNDSSIRGRRTGPPPPPPASVPGVAAAVPAGVQVGRVIEVTVDRVLDKEVEVKLADGRVGVVPKADIEGADGRMPSPGDSIVVALLAREDPQRRIVVSRSWAKKQQAWERLEAAAAGHHPLTGTVQRVVKGGVVVSVGVGAFLPASLLDEHPVADLNEFVGREIEVFVAELDRAAGKVLVNRRDVLRRARRERERSAFANLQVGARRRGVVAVLTEYGALVDFDGARGLLHRKEMSWGWVNAPSDVYSVGDEVEVLITEVNRSKRRISLSVRQLSEDPFAVLSEGTVLNATITRVADYGAFAQIEDTDVEGLIHISEISDVPGYRPEHLVSPGETVLVKVLRIDRKRRRIGLSIREAVLIADD